MATQEQDEWERWVEENGGGQVGVDALDLAYRDGRFGEQRSRSAGVWLHRFRERAASTRRAEDHGLAKRSVIATESQADTAKKALDLSRIAIAISVFALLVSVVDLLVKK